MCMDTATVCVALAAPFRCHCCARTRHTEVAGDAETRDGGNVATEISHIRSQWGTHKRVIIHSIGNPSICIILRALVVGLGPVCSLYSKTISPFTTSSRKW